MSQTSQNELANENKSQRDLFTNFQKKYDDQIFKNEKLIKHILDIEEKMESLVITNKKLKELSIIQQKQISRTKELFYLHTR